MSGVIAGATPVPLPTSAQAATAIAGTYGTANAQGEVTGITCRETAGAAPVTVDLRDGSATGNIVATVVVPAGAAGVAATNIQWTHGPRFTKGLWVTVTGTGTLLGTVHII